MLYTPFIILFTLHLVIALPTLLCEFGLQIALEALMVAVLIILSVLELKRYEDNGKAMGVDQDGLGAPQIIVLIGFICAWILAYIILFMEK